jgi:hypothetical protein
MKRRIGVWGHVLVGLGSALAIGASRVLADAGPVGAYVALLLVVAVGASIAFYVVTHWRRRE